VASGPAEHERGLVRVAERVRVQALGGRKYLSRPLAQAPGLVGGQVSGQALHGDLNRGADDGIDGGPVQRWVASVYFGHYGFPSHEGTA
jgi:hypothetical protein